MPQRDRPWLVPTLAAVCAGGYLASFLTPVLMPAVVVISVTATCALVLRRRRSRALLLVLAGVAAWLALGLAGAWVLRDRAIHGPFWLLVALFALPLPIIPWLYWLTFRESDGVASHSLGTARAEGRGERGEDPAGASTALPSSLTPRPCSRTPDPGPRSPSPTGGEPS